MKTVLALLLFIGLAHAQTKQLAKTKRLGPTRSESIQLNICANQNFAKTVSCTFNVTNGWTIAVLGFGSGTAALNVATTATCGTLTAQTGTTTTAAQLWSLGTSTATGSCVITQTTSSASNIEIAMVVWVISPLLTNGVVDATVTTSNYATGGQSGAYSGPSVTGVTNNDIYLATSILNGSTASTIITSVNGPCTSDYSANIGGTGAVWVGAGHCIVPTAAAFAPGWLDNTTASKTYSSATIALQP